MDGTPNLTDEQFLFL